MNLNRILFFIGSCFWVLLLSGAFWYFGSKETWIWKRSWFFRFKERWSRKRTLIFFCVWISVALCSICILWLLFLLNRQMALVQDELGEKVRLYTNGFFPPPHPPGFFVDAFGLLGLFAAVLLVCGGIWVIGSRRGGLPAKAAGLAMVTTGLSSMYLTASIKLEKLFDLEVKTEVKAQIKAQLGGGRGFGAESLPAIYPFEKGARYRVGMSPTSSASIYKDGENSLMKHFDLMCERFASHGQAPALVMIIGSTDPSPLRRGARETFGSNFGLARARAEWVKLKWKAWEQRMGGSLPDACNVPDDNFLTLGSGPSITPEVRDGHREDLQEDRRADIWAFWGAHKQEEGKSRSGAISIGAPEIHFGKTPDEKDDGAK